MNLLLTLIPLIVGMDVLAFPDMDGDALLGRVDADVRRAARAALGGSDLLADVLWAEPQIHAALARAIRNELTRAQTQQARRRGRPGAAVSPSKAVIAPATSTTGAAPSTGGVTAVPPGSMDRVTPIAPGSLPRLPYVTFLDGPPDFGLESFLGDGMPSETPPRHAQGGPSDRSPKSDLSLISDRTLEP